MLYPVKIEFKDYSSGTWQDWSEYLIEAPGISKKVESESEGEAGVIVFDNASVSLKYDVGSPVYNAFSIDLSSKQRYLFRISAVKTDKTYVQLFEGMADFSTLKWLEYNKVISFEILDKLSALNILQDTLIRTKNTLNARVLAQHPSAVYLRFAFTPIGSPVPKECSEIWIRAIDSVGTVLEFNSPIIFPGELIRDPHTMNADSSSAYYLVTESWIETNLDGQKWNKIKIVPSLTAYHDGVTIDMSLGYCEYLEKEVYGIDILNYVAGVPQSIDGLKFLEVFIKSSWPDITVTFRGISTFNIALNYSGMLVDERPFGKDPLDVLKMLADSMKVYVFTDKTGNVIVQSKSSLDTGGTTRSIGNTKIVSGPEKKYFWDKLVDGVTVNVKSWVLDDVTGENLIGAAELTKQPTGFSALQKIKPKNSIKRELLVGDPNVDTQEELDTYAAQEALSVLNFYGLRHSSFDINLNLDDNTINWELIDNLPISTLTTFFTKIEIDLVTRNISLEAVEIDGHDYDFRQLVYASIVGSNMSFIGSSGASGSYYSGITPIFNLPLQMSGGIVSLLTTDNLKLTSNQLDTIQPIKTTDTPTFNQLSLSSGASSSLNAVRADRILATSFPLTGGGNLTADRTIALSYNSTNLKLTSNALNVIQDIATTSSPTFNLPNFTGGLKINGAALSDASRNLTAGNITASGNIQAASLTPTNLTTGYLPYKSATTLVNSPIYTNGTNVGIGTTGPLVKLQVAAASGSTSAVRFTTNDYVLASAGSNMSFNFGAASGDTYGAIQIGNGGSAGTGNLVLNPLGGNVGIGTTTGAEKLTVAGNISAATIKLSDLTDGYIPYHISDASGLANSIIYTNGTNINIGGTTLTEKLNLNGNAKIWGDIYSDNFNGVDPYQGYYIGRSGSVFNKISATELHVKTFIADLEQALAGSQIISKSVAKVAVDFTDLVNTYLEVESFEGYPTMAVFADNDIIRLRSFSRTSGGLTIQDNWIRVTLATTYNSNGYVNGFNSTSKTQAYNFVQLSGSLIVAKKGSLALDYGQSGDGIIETVAVGPTSGKPYQEIKTWTTAPYTDLTVKYRHGSLSGITDPILGTLTGYGLYSDNVYLKGKIVATSGKIGDWNLDTKLYNGSTRLEASASFKGLAVSGLVGIEESPIDLLKVGQFTLPAMSEYDVNLPEFTYGKTLNWGTFTQTSTSATSTSGVAFWSNATGLLMDSFSWSISNASTYLNKFVRIAFNVVVPAGQNGGYFQQTVTVKLLNGSTVIYTETRNGYATGSAYTLSVDKTFLCLGSNIQVQVELYSSYGYYNHIPITSINITQAYYIDSTPITEINNGNLRIYDSGGRRSFEYNSTEGIKIKTGFKIGSWYITDGSGSNSLSFYYNNVLVKTLGSDGSWA